jgi:adenosylmethionine-8-amino-7-oxononanoate aminotransferase
MHKLFAGTLQRQSVVALPVTRDELARFERFVAAHQHELAAMIIEPLVQAAGGFRFHEPETLSRIAAVARRHGLLVIFDEIATGFGRTGSLFACEQAEVVPDVITLSKALTGGTLPLAVTVARTHVFEAFLSDDPEAALMHGPTFCGNPLACAAANASLDLFARQPRLEQAAAIAAQLEAELAVCRPIRGVEDVRVKGAIGVVELEVPPDLDELRQRFIARGVWIRPFGRCVYLMPALTISSGELSVLTGAIAEVLQEYLG